MNHVLGSVANSSSPEGADNDIGPVVGLYVCGKQLEAVALLEGYTRDMLRVSEWKHMIRPSDAVPSMYKSAITTLSFLPSVTAKAIAALAYLSGQAVSTVYKTVAWHHYIIVECVDATFKVELLRDGVRVQGILGDEAGEGDKARDRRRRQLTHTMPEQEHPGAGEEVKHIDFTGYGTTVEPLKAWMAEHLQESYHLLEWNCQHFCDVVIALFRSCKTHS